MAEHYNLNFMHPQYGTTLNVDIDANFSVQEILEQLVLSGFVGRADASYDLELMGQALAQQTIFADIPKLYDGAVLKVIERLSAQPTRPSQATTNHPIQLHAQHPDNSLQFSAAYDGHRLIRDVIVRALQQGFLVGEAADFQVYKGAQALLLQESLYQQGLQEGDCLQFRRAVANAPKEVVAPSVTLHTLQEQVQLLETTIGGQLTQLQQQLPRDQALPDVGELSYESLEKVAKRLRKQGKEPSIEPLSLKGAPVLLYVFLVFLLLIALAVVAVVTLS